MNTIAAPSIQFAVVREDPRIEAQIISQLGSQHALLIASGGCTALHLRATQPQLDIELIDPNPAQLTLVDKKLAALANFDPDGATRAVFNIGNSDENGLHECGNFERLFRLLRTALDQFVIPSNDRHRRFEDSHSNWDDVLTHRYWPAAFASTFTDQLLVAIFGPDAVQHATPGSYPTYFRERIERGLRADDRNTNPWLHHILLGQYRETAVAWPPFLQERHTQFGGFPTHECPLLQLPSFESFDFVQLSNVMDWMGEPCCRELAQRLRRELRPGAAILWRQLNNFRDLTDYFTPDFAFDKQRDTALTNEERSLFYNQVHCGIRK